MLWRRAIRVAVAAGGFVLIGPGAIPGVERAVGLGPAAARAQGQAQGNAGPSEAEEAIRAVDDAFVRDYNRGDSKALASLFTEDAEVIEADGPRYQGRDLIERRLAETFAANRGAKLALEIEAIRLLSPDVAREEGRSTVTPGPGSEPMGPVSRLYSVLYVRRDGRWLLSSVLEEPDPLVRPHDRLRALEWMIGDWVDEGSDSVVRVNCRWSEDENFLIRSFTVRRRGKPVMSVTQRIGWDPLARQIRSWEFDSEGGYGEGKWTRDGTRWIVKHTGVRPEGTTASATNIMVRERPDLVRWVSVDRILGDEAVPDDEGYTLVRVPPAPSGARSGAATSSASTPSPNASTNNETRSVR